MKGEGYEGAKARGIYLEKGGSGQVASGGRNLTAALVYRKEASESSGVGGTSANI